MARLDRRLLPLLDTLTAAGMDWLVVELIEGIRIGRVHEEPAEDLAAGRQRIQEGLVDSLPDAADSFAEGEPFLEPLEGNQQITWAASYVAARIQDEIEMLTDALDRLDAIDRESAEKTLTPIILAFEDEEQSIEVDHRRAAQALEMLPELARHLRNWEMSALELSSDAG